MRKKLKGILFLMIVFFLVCSGSVFAFSDIKGDPAEYEIKELKEQGIINGINDELFAPNKELTYAGAVTLLVKAFDLNLAHFSFIKQPEAKDYYINVKDGEWYSEPFIVGHLNGLPIPKDVNPNANITREQFGHLLFEAIKRKGDYAFIEIWMNISDEDKIESEYMNSIQKLIISDIVQLDKNSNFYPDQIITRGQAAKMIYKGLEFVKSQNKHDKDPVNPKDVTLDISAVTKDVNEVTISWGMKNFGHDIHIDKIEFNKNGEAVIFYTLEYPLPDMVRPAVMVEPKATTYISSKFKPILKQS